jgi:hypothetical protein
MATRERTEVDTHCDRCDRRILTLASWVMLTPDGPKAPADAVVYPEHSVDLCRHCSRSLDKWWARGKKGE